jgi:chemotaxis response regulator CheB
VAAAQKTPRRTAIAKTRTKNKAPKRQLVKVTFPPTTPATSLDRPVQMPGFLIVGIGASAGGLEAMEDFFRHMSPSSGMAFVVVSHQHAGHVSLLPSLLSKCTAIPVVEATDGMKVEANRIYLAPGGTQLALNGRQLEQALVQPGRILLAMEEVQGREGEGKVQVQVERNPDPEPHFALRRTM